MGFNSGFKGLKYRVKVKVKVTLEEAMEVQKGSRCTLSLTSALDGVGGYRHAPATLPPGKDLAPIV